MVGRHHQLNGHELEQTQGNSEEQGSLVCCSPWGGKESETTEWLNYNNNHNTSTRNNNLKRKLRKLPSYNSIKNKIPRRKCNQGGEIFLWCLLSHKNLLDVIISWWFLLLSLAAKKQSRMPRYSITKLCLFLLYLVAFPQKILCQPGLDIDLLFILQSPNLVFRFCVYPPAHHLRQSY